MTVRIFKPAKTAMQSGTRKTKKWVLEYPPLDRPDPNPLMGWPQSMDTIKQARLEFDSLEEATAYAKKKELDYVVIEPEASSSKTKSYADNFRFNKIGVS